MLGGARSSADQGPAHVAVIMAGNGRWAESRGLPRLHGHKRGADRVREVVEAKLAGGEVKEPEDKPEESAEVVDLLAALQASVDRAKKARGEAAS